MPVFWVVAVLVVGWVVKLVLSWLIFHRLISTYVISHTEEGALAAIEKLLKAGYSVTSDPLGEFVTDNREIQAILEYYRRHIEKLGALKKRYPLKEVSIAIKPSRFGAGISKVHFMYYALELCNIALTHDIFVWFDAEKIKHRQLVLSALLFLARKKRKRNFGLALQSMHSNSSAILVQLASSGIPVRIIKGAYKDGDVKESRAISDYFILLYRQAKNGYTLTGRIAVGTCDSQILDKIADHGIRYQFLFGVRSKLQEEYLASNRSVLIYAPWGTFKQARGFLFRRIREGVKIGMLLNFIRNIFEARKFRKKYGI